MQCSGMQVPYVQLTGEDLSLLYIYIDAVCWYARPLCLIDWGGPISLRYIYIYIYIYSVVVCKASMLD